MSIPRKGEPMATNDKCCTIVPYFKVTEARLTDFKKIADQCVAQTSEEPGCLYYGFSFDGNAAHCREGYVDADAALAHLKNIDPLLQQALQISALTRLEIHGPAEELAKLREPLAKLQPQFYTLEYGFRR